MRAVAAMAFRPTRLRQRPAPSTRRYLRTGRRAPASSTTKLPRSSCRRWRRRAGPTRCPGACARRRRATTRGSQISLCPTSTDSSTRSPRRRRTSTRRRWAASAPRFAGALYWRRPPSPHQAMPTKTRSTRCAKRPASRRASHAHYGATRCGEPCSRSCLHMSSRTTSTTFRSIVSCAHVTRHCSRCTFTSATAAARTP